MRQPNILLVVLDTARAKNASPSMNPEVVPNLAEMKKEAVEYTNATTTGPWTVPSHASLFTGQYTSSHQTHAGSRNFSPDSNTLAECLNSAGYQTISISNNSWISPEFGFDAGFDHFFRGWEIFQNDVNLSKVIRENDSVPDRAASFLDELSYNNVLGAITNALYARFIDRKYDYGALLTNYRIKRWLLKQWDNQSPFFMFVNYLEPHLRYDPPRSYRYRHLPSDISKDHLNSVNQDPWSYICGNTQMSEEDFKALEALYKSELSYLDYRLGNLFNFLREEDILDETAVIIVGDHGENIGEHGLMDHQYSLHDTVLHIPLLIRYPKSVHGGQSITSLVEVRDLFPTILTLAGLAGQRDKNSSSTLLIPDENSGLEERRHVFAEYLIPQPSIEKLAQKGPDTPQSLDRFNRALRCVRTSEWKFIETNRGEYMLFNIIHDPDEEINVAEDHTEVVDRLHRTLQDKFGPLTLDTDQSMRNHTHGRLRDLGYL